VIPALAYAPWTGEPVTVDHESIVKAYAASPAMLGRGHTLIDPAGPPWVRGARRMRRQPLTRGHRQSLACSDYHPQLAVAGADGACTTMNMCRGTRRGGKVVRVTYAGLAGVSRC
jgi:transcription factor C subunit 6